MAEKEYEKRIAEAKAALNSYSAEQQAIAKLYEQARKNASDAYEAGQARLEKDAQADRNRASVEMLRTERNLDQTLASRGLAFSGENAQTRLDLSLALKNRLADIDGQAQEQKRSLQEAHNDRMTQLELEYAGRRADGAAKKASLTSTLAGIQQEQQANEIASGAENTGPTAAAAGLSIARKKGENDLQYSLRRALTLAAMANANANGNTNTAGTTQGMLPGISAKELAKQMVSSLGSRGKILGSVQQKRVQQLLQEISQELKLDDAYYNELLLNLRSLGYRPNYEEQENSQTAILQKNATELFERAYRRYRQIYLNAGLDTNESDAQAGDDARFEQMCYLYARCEEREEFETMLIKMGLIEYLSGFYERIAQENLEAPGKYQLGSAVN